MSEQIFHCPNCGAILNNQEGFTPDVDAWVCTNCGQFMQSETVPVQPIPTRSAPQQYYEPPVQEKRTSSIKEEPKKRKRHPVRNFFLLMLVLFCVGGYYLYQNEYKDLINVSHLPKEWIGKNYFDTLISLQKQDLKNIKLQAVETTTRGKKTEPGKVIEIKFKDSDSLINWIIKQISRKSETIPIFINKDSEVQIDYIPFDTKDKNGFDEKKNETVEFQKLILSLPNYYVIEPGNAASLKFTVKNDNTTFLIIQTSDSQEWPEKTYKYPYVIYADEHIINNIYSYPGQLSKFLAKQNDKVYHIENFCFAPIMQENVFHITLISPDDCKTDYSGDFGEIIDSIIVLDAHTVRFNSSTKELKGKNINEVKKRLEQAGFSISNFKEETETTKDKNKLNTVINVTINDNEPLTENGIYSRDATITITYYSE